MSGADERSDLAAFVREFYARRAAGDMDAVRVMIDPDVVWCEPDVGTHMGRLEGAEAVLDMLGRALAATRGSFSLRVTDAVATATHCAAVIAWNAEREAVALTGRELAVYEIAGGRIVAAAFYPEDFRRDRFFWTGRNEE